jgi:hypothetical protein
VTAQVLNVPFPHPKLRAMPLHVIITYKHKATPDGKQISVESYGYCLAKFTYLQQLPLAYNLLLAISLGYNKRWHLTENLKDDNLCLKKQNLLR